MAPKTTDTSRPTRTSFNEGWLVKPKTSFFAELRPGTGAAVEVRLPHDALIGNSRVPSEDGSSTGYVPGGAFAYSKTFDAPIEWQDRHVTIEFEGVYRDAMVFINDEFAAQRPYGYSGFRVDATPFLRFGEENVVRVEARAHEDSRWYSGAGIYRDVWLTVAGEVHVDEAGVQVTTPDVSDSQAVVNVATTLRNSSSRPRTVRVASSISDAGAHVVARDEAPITVMPNAIAVLRQRVYVSEPQLWNLEAPHVYALTTTVLDGESIEEVVRTTFGIRTLQLDVAHGLRLNGRAVDLRGACIHHDNGPLGAATIRRAEERRIELLKEAGFNAIRSSHNPLSPAMLDACDRLGMLVIDEAFDVWTESKSSFDYSVRFPEWWERDVQAMILKDRNHPSVIMYSIGNEIPETGQSIGAGWGRRIAEEIRRLDSTRFITNGINPMVSVIYRLSAMGRQLDGGVNAAMNELGDLVKNIATSDLVTTSTEESFSVLDVAGLNYGEARYEQDRELFPNRVIVGTETFPLRIADNWDAVSKHPHVIGDFTWTGWDYLGEVGIGRVSYADQGPQAFAAPYPWRTAWCGDIDVIGLRRPVSYFREIVFGMRSQPFVAVQPPEHFEREPRITQWSWTDGIASWDWDVPDGSPIRVEVYSDAPEVELLVNGRSAGVAPAGRASGFKAVIETVYERGELVAVTRGRHGGDESFRLATPAMGRRLRLDVDRAIIEASDGDLAFVTATIEDDEGQVHVRGSESLAISIDGPGLLQAVGNGDPRGEYSFVEPSVPTYEGHALAIVRPTGPGEIRVTVTAGDLTATELIVAAVI
ncbi:MAG TPA: glycoside hydrolase family 2 TIM barrel-domain containing protein [Agromyces sp.]|nr:glycoside hydrolase family 2 TIM barrel-domain containing protein [Agromyces sp.]